jgi:RNA polymerase sigma factor for flagellar operon FliA
VRAENVERLRRALAQLSDREREVLRLYDWEGAPLAVIGRALQLTEARVSQLRIRAVTRLREQLAEVLEAA